MCFIALQEFQNFFGPVSSFVAFNLGTVTNRQSFDRELNEHTTALASLICCYKCLLCVSIYELYIITYR